MPNAEMPEDGDGKHTAGRRASIERWAEFVRTHDDAEWSRQQNVLIDLQLQSANELARSGGTDPVRIFRSG